MLGERNGGKRRKRYRHTYMRKREKKPHPLPDFDTNLTRLIYLWEARNLCIHLPNQFIFLLAMFFFYVTLFYTHSQISKFISFLFKSF